MVLDSPAVLVIGFNRPDAIRACVEAISRVKPTRMYVACDGARPSHPDDADRVAAVREAMRSIPWRCEIRERFSERNQGCSAGVTAAVSWFLEHEESGIVIEDDCLVDPAFFRYTAELLERYREDERVAAVCASSPLPPGALPANSYRFSRYMNAWGWATWRRAWKRFELKPAILPADRVSPRFLGAWHSARAARKWRRRLATPPEAPPPSWDYLLNYAMWRHGMVAAVPGRNLVRNTGHNELGTHCTKPSPWDGLEARPLEFPLVHPRDVRPDDAVDRFLEDWRYHAAPWMQAKYLRTAWRMGWLSVDWARGWRSGARF